MDEHRKQQVSLRGASAKEITRDALLEKVSQERELRSYARRAVAAAFFIQRVWRRYKVTKMVALKLQEEWDSVLANYNARRVSATWISNVVLRPFLFFIGVSTIRHQKIQTKEIDCMQKCFRILLESLNSTDSKKNFCSFATGTHEERRIWLYQARKLISLSVFILGECNKCDVVGQDIVVLTTLVMRLVVFLTDPKAWKSITDNNKQDADMAVRNLVYFMGSCKSGIYKYIRRYICTLDVSFSSQKNNNVQTDDKLLVTASAVTLALRPFHLTNFDASGPGMLDVDDVAVQYCVFLLTIPWLAQRLPAVIIPALKHKCILLPCFWNVLILKERILTEMSEMNQSEIHFSSKVIPPVGWALANIICLASGSENGSVDPGRFSQGLDCASYVHVVITLAENLLGWIENVGWMKETQDMQIDVYADRPHGTETTHGLKMSYMDLLRPVCQQWHLTNLLALMKTYSFTHSVETMPPNNIEHFQKLELLDVAYFYSYLLRIFSVLNPTLGSLPILNMLSFTPGFLVNLWGALESIFFPGNNLVTERDHPLYVSKNSGKRKDGILVKKEKGANKDGVNKWVNVLNKVTGKSQAGIDLVDSHPKPSQDDNDSCDVWDIEPLKCGPQGISKDMTCLLHLFSATYSHLLLILDDIEFYEKQHYDGDVKEISLDFTVTEESFGKRHVVELKPGGKDISVTNENKMQYVHAIADYKLNRQILPFSNAFYRGLTDLISPSWLKLFNASEFNQLLSGGNHDIDVDDLRNNTRYTGGFSEGSRTIKIFWEVIRDFEPEERCMLLKFVTSCSRAPLLGFKHLQPAFTIHKVACDVPLWATIGGQDVDRLPSASTCYNTLKLPTYKRSSTLRAKLLYAISSNAGFELS
ncbi:hypothetical protein I3843_09G006100 [Carya illinoinensis]|uniref:HECT-type E3 ubiquitin transferase n=1 Tax=Carya illinoinensis TaxID=32201 RepID=A0A922J515_CARIL|nr:hypothetical protein I3760_09G005700 [Carya illinoinensis]KAG6693548.1 hypothetical protein I3842_09G006200 [Carya illinoinensis]KAG7961249.1 hypothetical protein I3843_09G006100 [Carya illinoinensis]